MKITQILVIALICLIGSQAYAGDKKEFKKKHPRRAEVLGRANNEEKKNEAAEKEGKITEKQEQKLNRQDQRIKRQEQRDARKNGGHISKGEQNQLNKEEDRVNVERNNMEKRDAAKGTNAPTVPSTGN